MVLQFIYYFIFLTSESKTTFSPLEIDDCCQKITTQGAPLAFQVQKVVTEV